MDMKVLHVWLTVATKSSPSKHQKYSLFVCCVSILHLNFLGVLHAKASTNSNAAESTTPQRQRQLHHAFE